MLPLVAIPCLNLPFVTQFHCTDVPITPAIEEAQKLIENSHQYGGMRRTCRFIMNNLVDIARAHQLSTNNIFQLFLKFAEPHKDEYQKSIHEALLYAALEIELSGLTEAAKKIYELVVKFPFTLSDKCIHTTALDRLDWLYYPQNRQANKDFAFILQAAQDGVRGAQVHLAHTYMEGNSFVAPDLLQAAKLLQEASDWGYEPQVDLLDQVIGAMSNYQRGVFYCGWYASFCYYKPFKAHGGDVDKALHYLCLATIETGSSDAASASHELQLLQNGGCLGSIRQANVFETKATKLLREAAEQGDGESALKLSQYYLKKSTNKGDAAGKTYDHLAVHYASLAMKSGFNTHYTSYLFFMESIHRNVPGAIDYIYELGELISVNFFTKKNIFADEYAVNDCFLRLAEQGMAKAAYRLATYYTYFVNQDKLCDLIVGRYKQENNQTWLYFAEKEEYRKEFKYLEGAFETIKRKDDLYLKYGKLLKALEYYEFADKLGHKYANRAATCLRLWLTQKIENGQKVNQNEYSGTTGLIEMEDHQNNLFLLGKIHYESRIPTLKNNALALYYLNEAASQGHRPARHLFLSINKIGLEKPTCSLTPGPMAQEPATVSARTYQQSRNTHSTYPPGDKHKKKDTSQMDGNCLIS